MNIIQQKKATIEDYLVHFVITINTLRHSSQAAKKFVIANITRLVLNNRNQMCSKKPLFKNFCKFSESDLASAVQ